MRAGKWSKLHILLLTILLLSMAFSSAAEEEPLTFTVESDPDCLLSEAGDMTFFRFTVKNDLDEDYTLEDMSLQGDLLAAPKLIAQSITINANDVLEFTLQNVRIEDFAFDMDLSFQLTWSTTDYAPEDVDRLEPTVTDHIVAAPIRIERFVEPLMQVSVSPDVHQAREGDPVSVTYTLLNDTKFDMTNITLQDTGVPQPVIELDRSVLYAGEQMKATATVLMGASSLELDPTVQYTVRGVESKASAAESVTVERVVVDLRMDVEKYPATAEGTLFRITLTNDGTHAMTDIRIVDEIGTPIVDGISLRAGRERTVSYSVPSAAASGTVRYVSFTVTANDCVGEQVTVNGLTAYEVLPFVDSDQVKLKLTVSTQSCVQNDDGSTRLKLLFEIRNDSLVPISSAIVTEGDYFKGTVNEYETLSTGITTFEKEFIVPEGTRSLTFVMTALDPAQTQYATEPVILDLSPLAAPKPTSVPAIRPGKTVDVSGTIYDTERYIKQFRMAALIALALTMVFALLSVIFHVAELNVRRWLPKEHVVRPFGPRKARTASSLTAQSVDHVHDLFGYQQPAKLRYMDRTDRLPAVGQEAESPAPVPTAQTTVSAPSSPTKIQTVVSRNTNASRRAGEITAVPIHKPRTRPVMMSSNDTMPFAPVHEEQSEKEPAVEVRKAQAEAATAQQPSLKPRVIESKPVPRIVPRKKLEIIRVEQP